MTPAHRASAGAARLPARTGLPPTSVSARASTSRKASVSRSAPVSATAMSGRASLPATPASPNATPPWVAVLSFAILAIMALLPTSALAADPGLPAVTIQNAAGGGQSYSLTIQVLLLMTAVTMLPAILLMMTAFTRIVIVLGILRQALGAGNTPPNQVLVGLSLFLTLFVMSPVVEQIKTDAYQPYVAGTLDASAAMDKALVPLKKFMLDQTRESDIATFVRISGGKGYATPQDVPLTILVPSFVTSELKTAFLIGFLIFIPFVIIDLVVASVLMSMGMMMLSPVLISLPFKLMLFVLVDGWALVMGTLASSFYS